jgi:hypothetical protein
MMRRYRFGWLGVCTLKNITGNLLRKSALAVKGGDSGQPVSLKIDAGERSIPLG